MSIPDLNSGSASMLLYSTLKCGCFVYSDIVVGVLSNGGVILRDSRFASPRFPSPRFASPLWRSPWRLDPLPSAQKEGALAFMDVSYLFIVISFLFLL